MEKQYLFNADGTIKGGYTAKGKPRQRGLTYGSSAWIKALKTFRDDGISNAYQLIDKTDTSIIYDEENKRVYDTGIEKNRIRVAKLLSKQGLVPSLSNPRIYGISKPYDFSYDEKQYFIPFEIVQNDQTLGWDDAMDVYELAINTEVPHIIRYNAAIEDVYFHIVVFLKSDDGKEGRISAEARKFKYWEQIKNDILNAIDNQSYKNPRIVRCEGKALDKGWYVSQNSGGCNSAHLNTIVKLNSLRLVNPPSRNNNCFFKCIEGVSGMNENFKATKVVCNILRSELGVEPNEKITIQKAHEFINKYSLKVALLNKDEEYLGGVSADTEPERVIILLEDHYVYSTGMKKKTCEICNYEYMYRHTQQSCENTMKSKKTWFYDGTTKINKKKQRKQQDLANPDVLHFDIETYLEQIPNRPNMKRHTPFIVGYTTNDGWAYNAGENCFADFIHYLQYDCPLNIKHISAYNGSGFDFYPLIGEYIKTNDATNLLWSNGRLIKGTIKVGDREYGLFDLSNHTIGTLRDNLINIKSKWLKGDIDYSKFKRWEDTEQSHREEIIEYLEADVMGLQDLFNQLNSALYTKWGRNMTEFLTTSHTTYNIFLHEIDGKNWIQKHNHKASTMIRQAIYGGRVYPNKKVFNTSKPLTADNDDYLMNIDKVSLYPSAMSKYEYPIGKCYFSNKEQPQYMGIYECDVIPPKNILNPVLGRRGDDGGLVWDLNNRRQTLSSVAIEDARKRGYSINVLRGFIWKQRAFVFKKYIDQLYSDKENAVKGSPAYELAKLFMNGLYGKLIQKPIHEKQVYVNSVCDMMKVITDKSRATTDMTQLGNSVVLTTLSKSVDELDKDITKPVEWGVFCLDYSKRIMLETMDLLGDTQDDLYYYTDTDSIHIHRKSYEKIKHLCDKNINWTDRFDDELKGGRIFNATYAEPKMYSLIHAKPLNSDILELPTKCYMKSKGVSNKFMEWGHYQKLLRGEQISINLKYRCFKKKGIEESDDIKLTVVQEEIGDKILGKTIWRGREFNADNTKSIPKGYLDEVGVDLINDSLISNLLVI